MRSRWTMLLSATALAAATSICATPAHADPNLTDLDVTPRNYPPTYPEVQNKILDMTSSINMPSAWLQTDFRDVTTERQFNSIRGVTREMLDLQTLGDDNIRVRDLASPYTTALSCFSSYYRVTGTEVPIGGTPCGNIVEYQKEEITQTTTVLPPVQPRVEPAPVRPVPALW